MTLDDERSGTMHEHRAADTGQYAEKDVHPAVADKLRYFAFGHLPDGPLRNTSAACAQLAERMVQDLPGNAQLTIGLQKLLEAKDCFVRAALDADYGGLT
jgi:hypothetical protein